MLCPSPSWLSSLTVSYFPVPGIVRLFYLCKDSLYHIKAINEVVSSFLFPLAGEHQEGTKHQAVVVHAFNPSTWEAEAEAEAGRFLS
jgi:hypothetical protein